MFNIIARHTLLTYCELHPNATNALREWYSQKIKSDFTNFHQVKALFGNASLVGDNRVVFNIMGNHYRLVVRIVFEYKTIQIKWFGTHAEYDKIDVKTINYKP
ncbi:type II toxin-antitoxin system HigB family toxin [Dyadobacter crusticola]|uniref:type II toxin-antitoxin system HigB family toxin n=1 Tax=Dyadobacter crusticola TaxID=292407 RepID=UPI0004E1A318|nr:type II toxin-antitoxin system HigB family toxin [Dyadobacter crusticola]